MQKDTPDKHIGAIAEDDDPTASSRKRDHIDLAFQSQVERTRLDRRFFYEPVLSSHPQEDAPTGLTFLGKNLKVPIWVSSMTGGTEKAKIINRNLARVCRDFGMGMGLGSCRILLDSDEYLPDFDVRALIGPELPLYANLGVAQVETLMARKQTDKILALVDRLQVDGLVIHVNPMQEWLQPEGDRIRRTPLETVEELLESADLAIIVKEVGQGMGPASLEALLQLPVEAVEFAAHGGTNFSKVELLRNDPAYQALYEPLARIGHDAEEMVQHVNDIADRLGNRLQCRQIIISGGVKDFLDGYYLTEKVSLPSIYGQASGFLRHAQGDYNDLFNYVSAQIKGFQLAKAFLRVR